ncbi:MAG: hypothetical protein K9G09_01375 [Pontimonas sp.]|nr:hypothetical protein [Pontimonas sp.]
MNPSTFKAPAVLVVALILVAETLVLSGLSGFLIYQLAVDSPDSIASAVGLALITLAATAWIALTAIGFVQGKWFARGSAVVWQILQAAVGLASNQGLFARPDIGSGLFVPALVALALLLFSPSVSKHLGSSRDSG